MKLELELKRTAILRFASFEAENAGNGLRRFILRDHARKCAWVLLDEDWIGRVAGAPTEPQEFILLSEVSRNKVSEAPNESIGPASRCECNGMMIAWRQGIAERAGLGRIAIDATMFRRMEWKEILLG